jgi:hypothetical protein
MLPSNEKQRVRSQPFLCSVLYLVARHTSIPSNGSERRVSLLQEFYVHAAVAVCSSLLMSVLPGTFGPCVRQDSDVIGFDDHWGTFCLLNTCCDCCPM